MLFTLLLNGCVQKEFKNTICNFEEHTHKNFILRNKNNAIKTLMQDMHLKFNIIFHLFTNF